jgi:pimeloyl-ACP methyl ester carboxylesterase
MRANPRGGHASRSRLAAIAITASVLAAACTSAAPTSTPAPGATAPATPAAPASPGPTSLPPATPVPAPTQGPIAWNDCGGGFQCGIVDVPQDYADPNGPIVRLSLIRLPAADPARRIGSLVVNPGGPGASGDEFVRAAAEALFPESIRDRFDIVGFDPRGVGSSTPIRCVDNLDHFIPRDERADTPAELADLVAGDRAFAAGCGARNPGILAHLSTEEVARDLDQIRMALGEAKLTYLGFSYGTLIGEMYASLFPGHVRALALDGVMDPSLDEETLRLDQARAFEGALDRFLAACAADATCAFHSGGHPGPAFDALMARIDLHPVPTLRLAGREPAGPTQAWDAVLQALYSQATWPVLAEALADAARGDGSLLLLLGDPYRGRQPDGSYSNMQDAYEGVTCLDWPAPRDLAAYAALAARFTRAAPRFGRILAYNDLPCAFWPVPPVRTPAPVSAPTAPPILLVGSTGDPATPYAWAVSVSHQLTSSVLVTRVGEGHTGYRASSCVGEAVDAYLLALTVPAPGLTCH